MHRGRAGGHAESLAPPREEALARGAAFALTALVLLSAPWTRRAGLSSGWTGATALVAALLLAVSLARATRPASRRERRLGLALAGLFALGILQLLPLGPLLGWLSPASASLRACAGLEPLGCVALYPFAAREALLGLGTAAVVLLAARGLDARRARWLAALLVLSGLVQVGWSLRDPAALLRTGARGSWVNRNHFAGYLALLLPLALAQAQLGLGLVQRAKPGPARAAWGVAAGLLLIGVCLSLSRGGVAMACAGLVTYLALVREPGPRSRRRELQAALGLLGVVAAILLLVGWEALRRRLGAERIPEDAQSRLSLWLVGLRVFARFPLLGAGLRSHSEITPILDEQSTTLLDATHSEPINLLADLGLVGGALAAVGLVAWVQGARAALAALPRGRRRLLLAAACAGVAATLVGCLWDFHLQIRANLYACAALAGLALAPWARPAPARPATPRGRLAVGLAAATLAWHGGLLSLAAYHHGQAELSARPLAERSRSYARAARATPEDAAIYLDWGLALTAANDTRGAAGAFAEACRLRPRRAQAWNLLAEAELRLGRAPEAEAALRRAAALTPRFAWIRLPNARLWAWRCAHLPGATAEARGEALSGLRAALRAQPSLAHQVLDVALELPHPSEEDLERLLSADRPQGRELLGGALLARAERGGAELTYAEGRELARRGLRLLEPALTQAAGAQVWDLAARLAYAGKEPTRARELWIAAVERSRVPGPLLKRACGQLVREYHGWSALYLAEAACAAHPADGELWEERGRLLAYLGRTEAAVAALRHAQELSPRWGGTLLGDLYARQGLLDSAVLTWKRALVAAVRPEERAALRLRVARVLLQRGDRLGARAELEAALRLRPEDPQALELLRGLER
ncbi:MAG: O-antigen ligase family protein [Planctomycetota bacterium]